MSEIVESVMMITMSRSADGRTLNLPNIPGSKVAYRMSFPLTAIADFAELGRKTRCCRWRNLRQQQRPWALGQR